MFPIRIGISQCLLGDEVRFDGGHKREPFLTETLGRFVEWVPVCPEVEVGMGIPREPVHLVGTPSAPKMVTVTTKVDYTRAMERFSHRRLGELADLDLCGYVFKKDSPSCGMERVRLFDAQGTPVRTGIGLFARAFMERFPLIPVEEEGRLKDPHLRENFVERVFAYHRWRALLDRPITRGSVVRFHTRHKFQILAHSRPHYQQLGQVVADARRKTPRDLAERYGPLFMEALKVKATARKHVNVLQHLAACCNASLSAVEQDELRSAIDDYHKGLTPLIVPMTLIKHHVRRFQVSYLANQIYLNPHPKELMLRNHG